MLGTAIGAREQCVLAIERDGADRPLNDVGVDFNATVVDEAKNFGLKTVLVTEAVGTELAKMADVVIAIPRGRPGHVALHGATLVGLEALVLSLAAAKPDRALASLENLNRLRATVEGRRRTRS